MNNRIYFAHSLFARPEESHWYLLVYAPENISINVFDLEQSNYTYDG